MHKDGPRLWDDTLMEAERMATDSKARYLQLPTPDREAEMQRTRSQFFLLLRERLRNTYLRRISKLNPGEPLAWKYISGRKRHHFHPPHQFYWEVVNTLTKQQGEQRMPSIASFFHFTPLTRQLGFPKASIDRTHLWALFLLFLHHRAATS
ncbi:hypothetical protein C4B63_3g826 [Trypanosoma cruzi]|uniref:Uncharacterized protein n=1 Tax=Trypanosoma cruzi TaxID=5693 RepID=A0A2V2VZV8_TRYCR|nr:hypothetical protein C4B63_3g826 [Trypanosoma cruzi]